MGSPDLMREPGVRRLAFALRVFAGLFFLGALAYLLGPLLGPARQLLQTLPFVSNSIVKVSVLCGCCLYASGDLARYRGLVAIVIWAHVVSVVAMLLLILFGDVSRVLDPGLGVPQPVGRILWGAIALDGVILILLLGLYLPARRALRALVFPLTGGAGLSPAEQWLRRLLLALVGLFALGAIGYEAAPLLAVAPALVRELPFVTNSVVKVVTLALVCGYVARDLRYRMAIVGPVIAVHWISAVAQLIYLAAAGPDRLDELFLVLGRPMRMYQILWFAIALDGGLAALMFAVYHAAWRSRLKSEFFRPLEFRTLTALAEIMIEGETQPIPPEDAVRNVDRALARLETERKGIFRLALVVVHYWPLATLRPPLPELSAPLRATYVRRRLQREAGRRPTWQLLRTTLQGFTRLGHQLTVVGFYSDPRVHESIGYRPFTKRPRRPGEVIPPPRPHPLHVQRPGELSDDTIFTEVCVIGSGAGGSIMAYSLAERGQQVLLLERGAYVEPRYFVEDELQQLVVLYQRGMLQMSKDFRFNVLQGNCVGGSTTVNNAICFPPPDPVIAAWNAAGAGLDTGELRRATGWVRDFLEVRSLGGLPDDRHHPAARVIAPALGRLGNKLGLAPPAAFDANIRVTADPHDGCFGCGDCNIGCPYNRKLSMLDHTLPLAQARFPGRVTILAECEADRFRTRTGARCRAYELLVRGSDGRSLRIRAERFVVAAGAIASSALLLRSRIGSGRPVGRRLAFNMLTPVFAEFDQPQNAYAGIQTGHYVRHVEDAFIIETWFSPPVGLASAMGGWFADHYRTMQRSNYLVAYGLVVGTSPAGRAYLSPITGDSAFRFTPPPCDMSRLGRGLEALATVLFEAGARRVLLNTWDHGTLTSPVDFARVASLVSDPEFITLASSHPQGGNAINLDPNRGVVDEHFRVHGYENLYVCDASVFPGSVQVNPQMTVMALARYAAGRIDGW
jgi:choline dehydrogenase-like flavoprotein